MSDQSVVVGASLASEPFFGIVDVDGILLEANLPIKIGEPFWDLRWFQINPATPARIRTAILQAAQGFAARFVLEVFTRSTGNETAHVDFSLKPVYDAIGEIVFLTAKIELAAEDWQSAEIVALEEGASPIESRRVFQRALNNLSGPICASSAAFEIGPFPRVQIAETDLLQVFQNIVDNAIKYRGYFPPYIRARGLNSGGFCEFSIEDNGIGIDSQHSEMIFQAYWRLHHAAYPGAGIGLATCKRIVEHYGGRIWVQSELNAGATFFFTVPSA